MRILQQKLFKIPFWKAEQWVSFILALLLIVIAIFGRWITPHDPLDVQTSVRFQSPNFNYLMGTDNLGRDILSRTISGTHLALQSCFVILVSATILGLLIGLCSGFFGGIVDEILMRTSDVFIAFPGLVLALAIAAALGPNLTNAMIAISAVWWPGYARLIRGQVLAIKEQEFILASKSLGASNIFLIVKHIFPNVILPLVIQLTSDVGPALITTSSLSFIGMGAQPPTPEWGSMVSLGRKYLLDYWWISTFPGAAIFFSVLVFNGLGEIFRSSLNRQIE
jgi:peptide/nickel transport system permease protein